MKNPVKSAKGVNASGIALLNRALSLGYQPDTKSCGPTRFLREEKQRRKMRGCP